MQSARLTDRSRHRVRRAMATIVSICKPLCRWYAAAREMLLNRFGERLVFAQHDLGRAISLYQRVALTERIDRGRISLAKQPPE